MEQINTASFPLRLYISILGGVGGEVPPVVGLQITKGPVISKTNIYEI